MWPGGSQRSSLCRHGGNDPRWSLSVCSCLGRLLTEVRRYWFVIAAVSIGTVALSPGKRSMMVAGARTLTLLFGVCDSEPKSSRMSESLCLMAPCFSSCVLVHCLAAGGCCRLFCCPSGFYSTGGRCRSTHFFSTAVSLAFRSFNIPACASSGLGTGGWNRVVHPHTSACRLVLFFSCRSKEILLECQRQLIGSMQRSRGGFLADLRLLPRSLGFAR